MQSDGGVVGIVGGTLSGGIFAMEVAVVGLEGLSPPPPPKKAKGINKRANDHHGKLLTSAPVKFLQGQELLLGVAFISTPSDNIGSTLRASPARGIGWSANCSAPPIGTRP